MNPVKSASPARPAKAAKPAKPARQAKQARPARKARPARRLALAALALCAALCAGCAVVRGRAGDSTYTGWAFGEKASTTLAGLNITETQTLGGTNVLDRGVGVEKSASAGEADIGSIIGQLILAGIKASGVPAAPAAPGRLPLPTATAPAPADWTFASATTADSQLPTATAPAAAPAAQTAYSADGYGGSPGPAGEGVYGRPSCGRCQAYRAAHPDTAIINIDSPANRDDMWAALRLRGFAGQSVSLPVRVTADAYTQAAK
jgi:hypothetical protein